MKRLLFAMLCIVSALGMRAQTWTASDLAAGKYVFQNVGSGRYLGPSNSWGTQASLLQFSHYNTLAKISDGVYTIESQVSNGGTNYYFTGSFMDGAAANVTIQDDGNGIFTMSNGTTYYGYDGSSTVLASNLTDPTAANAQWKIVAYDEVYVNASEENPVDVTYMILDSNFDRNNRNGGGDNNDLGNKWTMVASNQNLCGGTNENKCAESWRAAFTLSQTITVPNGYYKLQAQAALTEYTVTGADFPVVYATSGANTVSVPFLTMQNGENSMNAMSTQFTNGNYFTGYTDVITVTNGSLTVGVKGTRTDTWCIWDNFNLVYMGPIDLTAYATELANAVTAAQAYESQLPAAVYASIEAVVTENNKTYTTEDEYTAAITAIYNAVSTYATATIIADYSRYKNVKAAALAVAPETDTEAADTQVEAATTTAAIDAAVVTLRQAFLDELPNVTVPEGGLDVTAVMVDNASVRQNTDYWTKEGTQHGNDSFGKCAYNECEFYAANFKFYQTLSLTSGTWEFGVTGFHRAGNHSTYFYAGEDRILIPGVASSVVNSMAQAQTYFDEGNGKVSLKFLMEEAKSIEIGIDNKDTETDKWTIFRDFTLKYYGAPDYSVYDQQWAEAVAAANEALEAQAYKYISGNERTAVTEAIDNAPVDGDKKAQYLEKIQALQDATATFKAAAPSYNAWVLAKTETQKLWGSTLGVAAPTTAAEAVAGVQNLNIAQYNKVATDYTFSATGLIGDFGSWTGTATVAGETAEPNYLSNEHWSGQTHAYYEQAASGWGNAGGWTIKYEKTCILPAGDYVIKVAARSSVDVTSNVSCTATENKISLPNVGNSGRGITKSGVASWADSDEFIASTAGVENAGAGWQWRFLPFTLEEETEVTMTFYAETNKQYNWMSISDGELLSTTKLAEDVAYNETAENEITNTIIADVTIARNVKEGLNTVVLPFALTANQVTAAFGSGAEVYNFSEDSEDAMNATVNFTKGDGSIAANVPVLVKATAASETQTFNGVQIVAATEAKVEGTNFDFVGVYAPMTVAEGDYFVNGGKLYKSVGSTNLKAFRAYIDNKSNGEGEVKLYIDGVATAISEINADVQESGVIYNLAGQRVSKATHGIYVKNGKKVVVK